MKTEPYRGRAASATLRELATTAGNVVERVSDVLSDTRAAVRGYLGFRGTAVSLADIEDWDLVSAVRVNLWLSGPTHTTRAALATIGPWLSAPVVTLHAGASLDCVARSRSIGTLILADVAALGLDDQRRLLAWLDDVADDTRVISVTSAPILPLLSTGAFREALYYRLNTLYIDLTREGKPSH
jgi:hypothetical protein